MHTVPVIRLVAALRAAWGLALTVRTDDLLGVLVRGEERSASLMLFARTVGIRDLVFGLAALADSFDAPDRVDRWLTIWLASDVADAIAGAAAWKRVGPARAIAASAATVPFIGAGVWALRKRSEERRDQAAIGAARAPGRRASITRRGNDAVPRAV